MRRLVLVLVLALGLLIPLAACNRTDTELCTRACWNHYELTYKQKVEEKIAALPPGEREAARQQELETLAARKADPDYGPFHACLENCAERGDRTMVTCWAEATTVEELDTCD